jgi:hypothetical protein
MKKKASEGVKEVRAFTTTDSKIHKNKKLADKHQARLNFRKKQGIIAGALRMYLDIPEVPEEEYDEKSKECVFLTEFYDVTGMEYDDLDTMVYDLMLMVLMKTNTKKWSEIFTLVEKYAEGLVEGV